MIFLVTAPPATIHPLVFVVGFVFFTCAAVGLRAIGRKRHD
jgi:hypothetical protein